MSSRWKWRAGILALVVLLAVGSVQAVLWSDWPRQTVISRLQNQFGFRITADSLDTGWTGHTEIHNTTLALPLASEPFLTVPVMRVRHSNLAVLAAGGFSLDSIELDRPTFTVRQDSTGSWNVKDILSLLQQAFVSPIAPATGSGGPSPPPVLPNITVTDGTVIVVDRDGHTASITPLTIDGHSMSAVAWSIAASVPGAFSITGQVAPGNQWNHRIQLSVQRIDSWAAALIPHWPSAVQMSADWSGQFTSAGLSGALSVKQLSTGTMHASGTLTWANQPSGAVVGLNNIQADMPDRAVPSLHLISGSVQLDSSNIRVQRLLVAALGGKAQVDGRWGLTDGTADLTAAWNDLELAPGLLHSGDVSLNVVRPSAGPGSVRAVLHSTGKADAGTWTTEVDIDGAGTNWNTIDWQLHAPILVAKGARTIIVHDLNGSLITRGTGAQLESIAIQGAGHGLTWRGGVDMHTGLAWLVADGRQILAPATGGQPVDFDLDTWGTRDRINVTHLYFRNEFRVVDLSGDYVFKRPKPLVARAAIFQVPPAVTPATQPFLAGVFYSSLDVQGTVQPLRLDAQGNLNGKDISIDHQFVGNPTIALIGQIDGQDARFHTTAFDVFGGHWQLAARWPMDQSDAHVDISVHDLPLGRASALDELAGTADAQFTIDVPQPSMAGITATGHASARDVIWRTADGPTTRFSAPSLNIGQIDIRDGQLTVQGARFSQPGGAIDATLAMDLRHPEQFSVTLFSGDNGWLTTPAGPNLFFRLRNLYAGLDVNVATRSARGTVWTKASAAWPSADRPIGSIDVTAELRDRVISISKIDAQLLGGTASGAAVVDLDYPEHSHGDVTITGVQAERIVDLAPKASGLVGTFDGSLRLAPSTGPRPLGPTRLVLDLLPRLAQINSVHLNAVHMTAFASRDRIVLADENGDPNTLQLAGGLVTLWGRVSRHSDGVLQSQLDIILKDLHLDQLADQGGSRPKKIAGLLSGNIDLVGDMRNWHSSTGTGSIKITKSDLTDLKIVAFLYDLMHILGRSHGNTGDGEINFTIGDNRLNLLSIRYFNKGTEALGDGQITNFWDFGQARMDAAFVGSGQPLGGINIPVLSDVNAVFSSIQHDLVAERVTGPLDDLKTEQINALNIGAGLIGLITGDVQNRGAGK